MQQPIMVGQPVAMVYGIPMQDSDTAKKVQRVIVCAGITALCAVIYYTFLFVESGAPVIIVNLGVALLIPACGYFGAKNKNKGLLCAFWGCNFLTCLCFGCLAICILVIIAIFHQWLAILHPFSDCCAKIDTCGYLSSCECQGTLGGQTLYFAADSNPQCPNATSTSTGHCSCCDGVKPGGGFCTPTDQGPGSSTADCAARYPHSCSNCANPSMSGSCKFSSSSNTVNNDLVCTDKASPCCLEKATCDEMKKISPYIGDLSGDKLYALGIIPIVFAIPACLACMFGYSLYNSPTYFITSPMLSNPYMAAPAGMGIPTQPAYGVQKQAQYAGGYGGE